MKYLLTILLLLFPLSCATQNIKVTPQSASLKNDIRIEGKWKVYTNNEGYIFLIDPKEEIKESHIIVWIINSPRKKIPIQLKKLSVECLSIDDALGEDGLVYEKIFKDEEGNIYSYIDSSYPSMNKKFTVWINK